MRNDYTFVLPLNNLICILPEVSNEPIQRFKPCDLAIESDEENRIIIIYWCKVNNYFILFTDMVHPYVWKEKFQVSVLYYTFIVSLWNLPVIYLFIGACDKSTAYKLNLWTINKSFISTPDGIMMYERQMNHIN